MSYKKQELLSLREHLGSPPVFGGAHVAHLVSFLCCALLVFVHPVSCVSNVPSVFVDHEQT
jgi:hypothetical protein